MNKTKSSQSVTLVKSGKKPQRKIIIEDDPEDDKVKGNYSNKSIKKQCKLMIKLKLITY